MGVRRSIPISETLPHRRADGTCRCGCGRKPEGRRRLWYAQECVDRALIASGQYHSYVLARDRGVCAACGTDTEAVDRDLRTVAPYGRPYHDARVERGYRRYGKLYGIDHVVPVVRGGAHALDNLRTLCTPCHARATAALAAARAHERRILATAWGPP